MKKSPPAPATPTNLPTMTNPEASGAVDASTAPLNVAVIGAGICGMCCAITLAERGHKVTLYERDVAPPTDQEDPFFHWNRRGAAQFRHPHAFLGLICNLFQERYPQLLDELTAAGARQVGFVDMLPFNLRESYEPAPGDEKMWVLMCRRATMETVIRRYAERLPGVEIVSECHVQGLMSDRSTGALRVRGLDIRFKDKPESESVLADVVVDASGRSSKSTRWLAAQAAPVREENDDAEIVYYTKHYRLLPEQEEPPRGKLPGAGDLGYLKFGVFPGDDGHFAIIVCVPKNEEALVSAVRDSEQFDAICRSIPGLAPWLEETRSVPTTDSFGIGLIHAVWRHFVEGDQPLAENFFAVGDAAVRTNPLYGRGCSTGVLHAGILADVLSAPGSPASRARRFAEQTESELRPIFNASLTEDKNGIKRSAAVREGRALDKPKSLKQWFGLAFGDALSAASQQEIHVVRGIMRTVNLLEKPGAFLQDSKIRRTVLRYMLRGRKRNAATRIQPGPTRLEMLQTLGLNESEFPTT